MRIGGMVWFAAGFAFCLVYLNDGIGGVLTAIISVVGGVVTFLLELGVTAGIGGVLLVIALALFAGRSWSERARGFYDADLLFRRRRNYRLPPDKRV